MTKAIERVTRVKPSEGYFVIPSQSGDILLRDELLPAMTQDKAAGHTSKGGFHSFSMPEHFELFNALYQLREKGGDVEEARQFIQTSMRSSYPSTSTRLIYTPEGKDKIIHGYKAESPIERKVGLIGQDGDVLEVLTPEASLALTGKNPEQVAELMNYINGTPTYIWRVNEKPSSNDERVAGFDADSAGAFLVANRNPRYANSALGVKFARSAAGK